jgi:uncharacterized Rmd1/YagE family protein
MRRRYPSELDTRVEVLNQRLSVLESLVAAVNHELESKYSSRLEWIVIWWVPLRIASHRQSSPQHA